MALFLPRIKASGRDVALLALGGCDGSPTRTSDGILMLPRAADPFGNDIVLGHADYVGADAVVTLCDPHVFDPEIYRQVRWCAWAPIDCAPVAPATARSLRAARWVWSPANHGVTQLASADIAATWVPHGVDSTVFSPKPRADARRLLEHFTGASFPDDIFVVMVCAANKSQPSRKGFYEALRAFKIFSDDHAPTAKIYVHAESRGAMGGENLHEVAALVGLAPERVVFPSQYHYISGMITPDYLAHAYSAADAFLSASYGEGFGLPAVEAGMCGTPTIVPDNSAQTETGITGWVCRDVAPYMPSAGTTWSRPDAHDLARLLERAHWWSKNASELHTAAVGTFGAREHDHLDVQIRYDMKELARRNALVYDADRVFKEHMLPAFERIERDIEAEKR